MWVSIARTLPIVLKHRGSFTVLPHHSFPMSGVPLPSCCNKSHVGSSMAAISTIHIIFSHVGGASVSCSVTWAGSNKAAFPGLSQHPLPMYVDPLLTVCATCMGSSRAAFHENWFALFSLACFVLGATCAEFTWVGSQACLTIFSYCKGWLGFLLSVTCVGGRRVVTTPC